MMTKEELAEQRRLAYVLGRVSGNQAIRLIDEIERLQAENERLSPKSSLCCCSCCDAFHEAGISPTDLPKFVEAVHAQYATYRGGSADRAMCSIHDAAYLLPENRK